MSLSQADLDLIKRIEKDHGIVLFKGPEYDKARYGTVRPIGERHFLPKDTRHEVQRVRDVQYEFRGLRFPTGIPVGVTKLYQKKYAEQSDSEDRVFINSIMDISWSEQQQLKHFALGQTPWTAEKRDERTRHREELRQKVAEDALTPNAAVAQTIAAAIQQALGTKAEAPAEQPKRSKKTEAVEELLSP